MLLRNNNHRRGFTLIELLIVIGIVGVLSAIVVVAINPKKQLCDAENARRVVMQREMTNALFQYIISTSDMPPNIPTTLETAKQICAKGVATGETCVSLDVLVPNYVAALPVDVSETDPTLTGYKVYANAGRPIAIAMYIGTCAAAAASSAASDSSAASSLEGSVVRFRIRLPMASSE